MESFRLKKTRKKLLVSTYIFVGLAFLSTGAYAVINNISNTNAEEEEFVFGFDEEGFEFGVDPDNYEERFNSNSVLGASAANFEKTCFLDKDGLPYCTTTDSGRPVPSEQYPASYSSLSQEDCINSVGCVSRVENQHNENLCWAYSYTTAIESTIRNTLFETPELSVKHLDYQLANNFSDQNNPYTSYIYGSNARRIGSSANYQLASIVSTGQNTLAIEDNFWQKLQNEDSTLSGINSYAEYLNNHSGYKSRISSDVVLNGSNSEYNLISYDTASGYLYYGENTPFEGEGAQSYTRDNFILYLKQSIQDYGAVGIGTHYNKTACGYVDSNNNFTIIDRTTRTGKTECNSGSLSTGHAINIVGWDDNWEYINNGETKKGAFIIQNSYGTAPGKEYLAYESAFTSFFVATGVEHSNYDHIYDYTDQLGSYTKNSSLESNYQLEYNSPNNVTPAGNELIFEFETKSNQPEKLERIAFSQRFKLAGVEYVFSLSTDGGETWEWMDVSYDDKDSVKYSYPGMQSLDLSSENILLDGSFMIKVYAGYNCLERYDDQTSQTYTCELNDKTAYTSSDFTDSEKKYDLLTVYTTDVDANTTGNHTVTFVTNNENYVGLSDTSITVPDGTTFSINDSTKEISFIKDNNEVGRVSATLLIAEEEHYTYSIIYPNRWESNIISSDRTIAINAHKKAKEYTIKFQGHYIDENNEDQYLTYIEKNVPYGSTPVYRQLLRYSEISTIMGTKVEYEELSINPNVLIFGEGYTGSFNFSGWEPEIIPVTDDAVYTAKFNIVQDSNGDGQGNQGGSEEGSNGNEQGNQGGNEENPVNDNQGNQNSSQGGSSSGNTGGSPAVPNTDPDDGINIDQSNDMNGGNSSSKQGSFVANTGYQTREDNYIQADMFITAMILGTIGFVIYIIKNRKHLRLRTT